MMQTLLKKVGVEYNTQKTMKILTLALGMSLVSLVTFAKEDITPTITPSSFDPQTEITVEYDVTGTLLADLDDTWIWVWIPGSNVDARYNFNPASSNTSATDNAKFTKSEVDGKTLFTITFTPEQFFEQPICLETKLGMLIKGNDWANGQSEDHEADMSPLASCFVAELISPSDDPTFVQSGGSLLVIAEASDPATFTLSIDGQQVDQQVSATNYSFTHTVTQTEGIIPASLLVADAENDTTITFSYVIDNPSLEQARPSGIIPGINYDASDATKATLCVLAPGKDSGYVLGEFNDFAIHPDNQMFRDGDYFWYEVTGLTSGVEYAFQYLIDGVYIADPFSDKILDPDDSGIPSNIYPNLKSYPQEARYSDWYKNRLSVIQTNQTEFNWQNNDYQRPKKEDLVIYELLVRDFFEEDDRNYENLIDTLSYFKSLGVNTIELMPIQEFGGNNNWGYQPTFMFAPDKAYGTKDALKRFIDAAHGEGISIILDIVLNQQDLPNPYIALWYDFGSNRVKADNPMFNVNATHPFNVFYDMNHESEMTQYYMDTTLHYWISEYKVDGYRFDLSKGFTQTNNPNNVGAWGNFDQSRVDILTRMYDEVREYSTDSHLILEHFADNSEETVLADYGFMLWGNMHWDYKDLMIGVSKNIAWGSHETRGWQEPNLVSFMESHDEQRVMYELLEHGGSSANYDTRNFSTAINRIKLANALFYTVPGPKMLWQFGELAYEHPINLCEDEVTIDDGCRTSIKPVEWGYAQNSERVKLSKFIRAMIDLKLSSDVFENGDFSMTNNNDLVKHISLANKDNISTPSNADEMSVYVVGNFELISQNVNMDLPFTGTWYDYFADGEELEATSNIVPISLDAGEFKVYVNFQIDFPDSDLTEVIASVEDELEFGQKLALYPNPVQHELTLELSENQRGTWAVEISDMAGRVITGFPLRDREVVNTQRWDRGMYIVRFENQGEYFSRKFIKN